MADLLPKDVRSKGLLTKLVDPFHLLPSLSFPSLYLPSLSPLFFPTGMPPSFPPMADLLPKDVKSKGLFTKLVDGVGYIAKAQGCALIPFDASGPDADSRKTPFRTEVLALKLSAPGKTSPHLPRKEGHQ